MSDLPPKKIALTKHNALRPLMRLLTAAGTRPWGKPRLPILIYHRVSPQPDALFPDMDAAAFDRQMQIVSSLFNPVPIDAAIRDLVSGTLSGRSICITFDDGYRDNVEVALPILEKHSIPATFFIASGYLDGRCMWNDALIEGLRETSLEMLDLTGLSLGQYLLSDIEQRRDSIRALIVKLKHLPFHEREQKVDQILEIVGVQRPSDLMMESSDVVSLAESGMEIGGHTVSHPILARLTTDEARREIMLNKNALENLLGKPLKYFAYPNGKPGQDYAAEHIAILREAGYSAAFSTALGAASSSDDLFQLPRFRPAETDVVRFSTRVIQQCLGSACARVDPIESASLATD